MTEDSGSLVSALQSADREYETARRAIEDVGEEIAAELTEAIAGVDTILETYEERATGTGDFGAYVTFRSELSSFIAELPDHLPCSEDFQSLDDIVDKRRLDERDFQRARDALTDAREISSRLDDRDEALVNYRETRQTVTNRRSAIEDRIDTLDRVLELGTVDLDAPVTDLRTPIEAYNESVTASFDEFLRGESACTVLSLFEHADNYPLVSLPSPPPELLTFVYGGDVPNVSIPDLLAYADYSQSKLEHYVNDPAALKQAVSTDRIYLERVSAKPFLIEWPPPPADILRWKGRELVSLVDRFAPSEVIEHLRTIRSLCLDADRFEHLRQVAQAQAELDDNQRTRLESGEVKRERDALAEELDRLQEALSTFPRR